MNVTIPSNLVALSNKYETNHPYINHKKIHEKFVKEKVWQKKLEYSIYTRMGQ